MAAYVLTDWPAIQALTRVADRGVNDLAETSGVPVTFGLIVGEGNA